MKIVVIGGSFESKFAMNFVANEVARQSQSDVSSYTFSFAMRNKRKIKQAVEGNLLITHSTGAMLAGQGINPAKAVFISPSQPVPGRVLFIRAAKKTYTHSLEFMRSGNRIQVARVLLSNILETIIHPVRNLKPVITGEIPSFDIRQFLPAAYPVRILISSNDEMFTKKENRLESGDGVEVIHLDAMHDEIFIDTKNIIKDALAD